MLNCGIKRESRAGHRGAVACRGRTERHGGPLAGPQEPHAGVHPGGWSEQSWMAYGLNKSSYAKCFAISNSMGDGVVGVTDTRVVRVVLEYDSDVGWRWWSPCKSSRLPCAGFT